MRRSVAGLAMTLVLGLTSCGASSEVEDLQRKVEELERQLSTTTVAPSTTTRTTVPTTTTTSALTPAQETYCTDLVTVIAVPTATGGTRSRAETVTFFELAYRMGYLELPYSKPAWGRAVAETPEDFVSITHVFAGAMSLDVGPALMLEWGLNMIEAEIDLEDAFREVCLQAWELR